MKDQTETPLAERKVLRRGLMAGLLSLGGAALLKVSGASKAEAAHGGNMLIGALNNEDTAATTYINANISGGPTFVGLNLSAGAPGIASGDGIQGQTDKGSLGAAGIRGTSTATSGVPLGVWGTVGPAGSIPVGIGVFGTGRPLSSAPTFLSVELGVAGFATGQAYVAPVLQTVLASKA